MFNLLLKRAELDKLQPLLDYLHNIDPRQPVVVEKKKNYTWLIVVTCLVCLAAAGFVVYKLFFEIGDEFDDFDDEDFEDIDFDEDYDEEFEEVVEEVVDEVVEDEEE